MSSNPIEVTDNQSQSYLGLLPYLTKFILSAIASPSLLPHNTIGLLTPLCQGFANIVVNFIWYHPLISFPTISIHSLQSVLIKLSYSNERREINRPSDASMRQKAGINYLPEVHFPSFTTEKGFGMIEHSSSGNEQLVGICQP